MADVDISKAPYYGRFKESDDYYAVAFKPAVSVQARELNDVQSIIQNQIERVADNLFSPGTILSGCNFLFLNPYPYVKLEDQDVFGNPVSPAALVNSHVISESSGLHGQIIDYADGFISADPNTKTLYINYLNTGSDSNTTVFAAGEVLRVYDGIRNGIEKVGVAAGGSGFSNTSRLFAVSALAVTPTSGTISNGDYISNGLGANVLVTAVDSLTLASVGQVILRVAPRPVDLANSLASSSAWTIANTQTIVNGSNTATGRVSAVIGTGFQGLVVTDGVGTVTQTLILNKGVGYTALPTITLLSPNNASGYTSLSLSPQNYVSRVQVASVASAVGNGYAFGVNEGTIYLKGRPLRVAPQKIIVSKYDVLPDNVAVGFTAIESIVDSNQDVNLNDPAAGDNNSAPGADRVKIVPRLSLMSTGEADANSGVFPIVRWNSGSPVIQQQQTVYSKIGDQMATQVADQSGDFFIDPFLVTSRSSLVNDPGITMDLVVDPGTAYISGRKVQTTANYTLNIPRALDVGVSTFNLSMNYGNYLTVHDVGGVFPHSTGAQVTLYDQPKGFLSNSSLVRTQNTAPVGNAIGTAYIRSLRLDSGTPGHADATYKLYLFGAVMNPGRAFQDARSVSAASNAGICDIQVVQSGTGANVVQIYQANGDTLVWRTGYQTLMSASNAQYSYLAYDNATLVQNTGVLTRSIASTPNEFYPYTGSLSPSQFNELVMVPTLNDLVSSTNAAGTWSSNSTALTLTGVSGAAASDFVVGDWVYALGNSSQADLRQITGITNNNFVSIDSALTAYSNTVLKLARAFPKNVPIPYRAGMGASVDANGNVLTVNFGTAFTTANSEHVDVSVPTLRVGVDPVTKTVNRSGFVKVYANAAPTGPWCLGVPDVFRLRSVFIGNSTVSNTGDNYVQAFSVDSGHTTDYHGLSWLYLRPGQANPMSGDLVALVEFDYYTTTGTGYYATTSYTHTANLSQITTNDRLPLANLTSMAATYEVPEFFTDDGQEVDLLGCIDFRPYAAATATPSSTPGSAPTNPASTLSFDTTAKRFPVPGAIFTSTVTRYLPRIDSIFVGTDGVPKWRQGTSIVGSGNSPATPPGMLKIADVLMPEYPQIPATRSPDLLGVLSTNIVNTRFQFKRLLSHSVSLIAGMNQNTAKRYTNRDIATLDRRLTNVENAVSLTALEASVKQLIIPSSSDPTVNRYQYGFFADDFSTVGFSDLTNSTYAASYEKGDVVPSKLEFEVYGGDDFNGAIPHIDFPIVSQLNATTGTKGDPTSMPQCAVALSNSVAYQLVYRSAFDYNNNNPVDGVTDVVTYTLADAGHITSGILTANAVGVDSASGNNTGPGTVTLWFYAYDHPVKFEIVQGNTVVVDSSSAVDLTSAEITDLTTSAKNSWFNDQVGLYMKSHVTSNTNYVMYAGKISWNYAGTGGDQLTIRTTNGAGVRNWRWVLSYPINGETAGCVPPPPPITCPAGYHFDGQTAGCVPDDSGTPDSPPVTNIDWTGCGNNLQSLYTLIQAAQARGATIGTVSVYYPNDSGGTSVTTSGSLADFQNPSSAQNLRLIAQEALAHAYSNSFNNGGISSGSPYGQVYLGWDPIAQVNYTILGDGAVHAQGQDSSGHLTDIVVAANAQALITASGYSGNLAAAIASI